MPEWIILGSRIFYWDWLTQQLVNTILIISSFELTSSFIKQTLQGHSRNISFVPSCPIFSSLFHHVIVPQMENLPSPGLSAPSYPVTSHLASKPKYNHHEVFQLLSPVSCPPSLNSIPECSHSQHGFPFTLLPSELLLFESGWLKKDRIPLRRAVPLISDLKCSPVAVHTARGKWYQKFRVEDSI